MPNIYNQWISDITTISIALLVDIFLTAKIFRILCKTKKEIPNAIRVQLYVIFVATTLNHFDNLLRVVALPMFGHSIPSQQPVCDTLSGLGIIFYCSSNLAIIYFFITRLKNVFADTQFKLSRCFYYVYFIVFSFMWGVVMTVGSWLVFINHVPPTNIYTASADTNGNGMTCTLTAAESVQKETKAIMAIILPTFVFSNLIAGYVFIQKLYHLLKFLAFAKADEEIQTFKMDLVRLMKDQTMLVTMMVTCSLLSLLLTIVVISVGQALNTISQTITLLIIVLAMAPDKKLFHLLRCDKCSAFCCKCFEQVFVRRMSSTNDEKNIVKNLHTKNVVSVETVPTQSNSQISSQISTVDVSSVDLPRVDASNTCKSSV